MALQRWFLQYVSFKSIDTKDYNTSKLVMDVLKAHVRERGLGLPEVRGDWLGFLGVYPIAIKQKNGQQRIVKNGLVVPSSILLWTPEIYL